jgi:hypothetical protein
MTLGVITVADLKKMGVDPYIYGVELAEIVVSIREIMTIKKDFMPFTFIARYGQPLLSKKHEG